MKEKKGRKNINFIILLLKKEKKKVRTKRV